MKFEKQKKLLIAKDLKEKNTFPSYILKEVHEEGFPSVGLYPTC